MAFQIEDMDDAFQDGMAVESFPNGHRLSEGGRTTMLGFDSLF